ncbi:hypothetical protein HYDPIDRAFT_34987 [Hydnomerulius pinastri MD-312]|uniref:Fungal-type protein kinase domain-containing protein n=1 Tax=Hydnomerulius pinastri MD-312 TaxID=994086 RepID=A0A0C2L7I2_9AGAM|nr:hypothetical protein HYDPIDRAFT_34987 [Hydnomerulius pinastri MD-312]
MHAAAKQAEPKRVWSSETSLKAIEDGKMALKPDIILRQLPSDTPALYRPSEFSWKGVISFLELTSLAYSSDLQRNMTCKAYVIFATQVGQCFLFALSIANQHLCLHMFDRSGVVHSRSYDIHRSPHMLLRMLCMLSFGLPQDVGYDPTFTFCPIMPQPRSS